MPLWEGGREKLLRALRMAGPTDTLGSAAAVVGLILVVSGVVLHADHGADFGAAVRTLGGAFLLVGLGAVLFGKPRRRVAITGAARRIAERYMAATAHWHWTSRWGLAGMAIGPILLAPALALEIIFGAFGGMFLAPGVLLFLGGAALIVFGRFCREGAAREPGAGTQTVRDGPGRWPGSAGAGPQKGRGRPGNAGRHLSRGRSGIGRQNRSAGLHRPLDEEDHRRSAQSGPAARGGRPAGARRPQRRGDAPRELHQHLK